MQLEFLKPFLYYVEKVAASRIIPDATVIPDRKLLKDYPIQHSEYAPSSEGRTFDHSKWNSVLQRHVRKHGTVNNIGNVNVVDYDAVAADTDYQAYLDYLTTAQPDKLVPIHQLAFWMNAYNALCISVICSHEKANSSVTLHSINNLSKPKSPVWDMVAGRVGGQDISLNEIEHEKLRKQWAEPAVHACIVCASASCPNLRPEAFVPERLRDQMDDQMRDWLSNTDKGLKLTGNRLELSRIFLWFEKDFGGWKGMQEFIPQYISDEAVAGKIRNGNVSLRYFDYDWSVNRTPK
jgi:hypothetical protein